MLLDLFFQLFGAIGMVSWFVWPFAFVFGLKRTIFYMRAPDGEDAAAQEQREKKALYCEILAGASLLVMFCTAVTVIGY